MKQTAILLCFFLHLSLAGVCAQDVIRLRECNNLSIRQQADSLKKVYDREGFEVIKEASITMENEYEMPVVVPLQEGSWYQFVFIGDAGSRLYEVRMYDWEEREVAYHKKMWGDIDGNIISFRYIAKSSGYHMFKPVQQNKKKKKDLCGYVMLLTKVR
jgi:hypothetical protein